MFAASWRDGRILDRLALLEQVIGRDHVRQVLEETECFDSRRCRLTREVIFWVVLAMGILTDLPIRQVFKYARRLRPGEVTPHRSSLCLARQRLGLAPVAACSNASSACWRYRKHRGPSTRTGG